MAYKRIRCANCEHEYEKMQIRKCPYSKRGLYVCVYCCKKCPYVKQVGTGFACTYKREQES